jgi:hypothetical protein
MGARMNRGTERLRERIPTEEFDYQALLSCLRGYARPRDKITDLIRKGLIIRVKKGLYVFGVGVARKPFSREILANLIYGPSYVSLEYALQHHGLIPEGVAAVTSVTCARARSFSTPVGLFIYREISMKAYERGAARTTLEDGRAFLIALPEKALADKVRDDRGTGIRSLRGMETYVLDNLRVDPDSLRSLSPDLLAEFAEGYGSRKLRLLSEWVRKRGAS